MRKIALVLFLIFLFLIFFFSRYHFCSCSVVRSVFTFRLWVSSGCHFSTVVFCVYSVRFLSFSTHCVVTNIYDTDTRTSVRAHAAIQIPHTHLVRLLRTTFGRDARRPCRRGPRPLHWKCLRKYFGLCLSVCVYAALHPPAANYATKLLYVLCTERFVGLLRLPVVRTLVLAVMHTYVLHR
jgi:hypothetical protein